MRVMIYRMDDCIHALVTDGGWDQHPENMDAPIGHEPWPVEGLAHGVADAIEHLRAMRREIDPLHPRDQRYEAEQADPEYQRQMALIRSSYRAYKEAEEAGVPIEERPLLIPKEFYEEARAKRGG